MTDNSKKEQAVANWQQQTFVKPAHSYKNNNEADKYKIPTKNTKKIRPGESSQVPNQRSSYPKLRMRTPSSESPETRTHEQIRLCSL